MKDIIKDPIFTQLLNENDHNHRKKLIQLIEKELGGKLICYIENIEHPLSSISLHDTIHFEEILRTAGDSKKGFLLINSGGGNGNAAEKLLMMCRKRFTESFTIIVPNFAKSAATMMCLGADKIMMGYLAELGPIDPQISISPSEPLVPARSFIDGLELVRKNVRDGDPSNMYLSMLQKVRPELISICQSAIDDAKCFAATWLSKYMLKDDTKQAELVATWLSDGQTYKSHGKVIDYVEARNVLKLNAEPINPDRELWYWIWELYVRSTLFLKSRGPATAKLYESEGVSLTMSIGSPPQ